MAAQKQKQAVRQRLKPARRATGPAKKPAGSHRLSTADQNDLPDSSFAFRKQRKEPLTDARHVRNAIARFDQVEGVTDADRTAAWLRIRAAARKFDVHVEVRGWRALMRGGKARK